MSAIDDFSGDDLDDLDRSDHNCVDGPRPKKYQPGGEPAPSKRGVNAPNTERRDHWVIAAIAGLCYLLILSGGFLLYREYGGFGIAVRGALSIAALTLTYAAAYAGTRIGNRELSTLFAIFGTVFYGLTLAALSKDVPNVAAGELELGEIFNGASAAILPYWAIGSFALASVIRSRVIHFVATLIALLWGVNDSTGLAALFIVIFCAVGEYWAWRHKSVSVSFLYISLCVYALFFETALWTRHESYAFVAAAVSVMLYWYGASLNNVIMRAAALTLASCALGYASFPQYWERTMSPEHQALLGRTCAIYLPSILCTAAFIAYCVNVTLGGAQHCTSRFVLGVGSVVCWTFAQTFYANKTFGALGAVCVMFVVALGFIAMLYMNSRLAAETKTKRKGSKLDFDLPETEHLDDVFDAEARQTQNSAPVFALAEEYREFTTRFLKRAKKPIVAGAIALQYALLIAMIASNYR